MAAHARSGTAACLQGAYARRAVPAGHPQLDRTQIRGTGIDRRSRAAVGPRNSLSESTAPISCCLESTLLVEAAAGTGKTALMVGRVTMLLASGVAPRDIAAI